MIFRVSQLLLLLFLSACPARAQGTISATTVIPAAGLQEDVAILRSTFEQLHPGLYRYSTRARMDRSFAALQHDLGHDLTLEQVFLRLALFTAQLRCGHTFPNPYNQSKEVTAALLDRGGKLPFLYRWIDGQMIVTRDLTPAHTLAPGTEVLSINGITARFLLHRLMQLASADGANDAKRISLSEEQGDSEYDNPDIFLPMLVPAWSSHLSLQIRKPHAGHLLSVSVTRLTAEQRKAALASLHPDLSGSQPIFTMRYLPGGAAVLTMPSWVMFHSAWDWRGWLNRALDELADRNAPALIVDLRGNGGGDDVGDLILARLRPAPSASSSFARLVRYRRVPADLLPHLSTWDKSFKDWGSKAVDLPAPWPTAPPVPYFRQIQDPEPAAAADPAFKHLPGKVYVLTDASNSSATFAFARALQQEHLGLLVGGATGGNQRGINGGAFFFLKLPHSGVEIDLPLIGYFPSTLQPDRGLTPDIPVSTSRIDIEAGTDPVIARVEDLLRRNESAEKREVAP